MIAATDREPNTPVIYFDYAATSWPKPAAVRTALNDYFGEAGGNPGRSGHQMSIAAARVVLEAREAVARLFNVSDPGRIVFTKNATEALNLAIYGLLRPGDHVVTSSLEHNSVMRPLRHLEAQGVEVTVVACSPAGLLDSNDVRHALRPDTRLLVTTHGSNVVGTLLPIGELAAVAHERGVPYLVDTAQTAGSIPIDVEALGVDLLAFTGHKGLLGLTGTGGLYVRDGLGLQPLMRGGTGSDSALEFQPDFMPDIYESGTLNVAGLAGLAAGVRFLCEIGIESVAAHERELVARFLAGAAEIPGLSLYGPEDPAQRCGVVSFNIAGLVPSEVSTILDRPFGIMSRPGLHCAPSAHRTLGTFPTGTVRFSVGWFNTSAEIDAAVGVLRDVAEWVTVQRVLPGPIPTET
ncbi:MAG: aminotransferase class V-fold PLP-dependent enzyme [Ardenticatenaceae bacterium]|nr:aminotransferase class V-fold PLP-dependent enzyme [Ardenticatenaceae bacterium]